MESAFRFLHSLMLLLHGIAEQENQNQPQHAAGDHEDHKTPVHGDENRRRANKADHDPDAVRQNVHDTVLDHGHVRKHPVYQLTAVISLDAGVLL